MKVKTSFRKKELAATSGISPETLRFYEKVGLIKPPPRSENGYRSYPASTVQRVQFIKEAKDLGFTLKEIEALLLVRAKGAVSCQSSAIYAKEKLLELDGKIKALRNVRK